MLRLGKLLGELQVTGLLHFYEKATVLVTDTMRPIKLIPLLDKEYNYIVNGCNCKCDIAKIKTGIQKEEAGEASKTILR